MDRARRERGSHPHETAVNGRGRLRSLEVKMVFLNKLNRFLNQALIFMGGCFIGVIVFLTCANIFLRSVGVPINGTFELVGYFGAVAMAFALGYTQMSKGHISVDVLVLGFPKGAQRALTAVNELICMIFFAMVAWKIAQYATTLWRTGELTETLRIIYFPFTYAVAFGCATLSLVFLTEFLKSVVGREDKS
jgi:TRAP-type C4-dicarboxylate transport system permease small subunit